VNAALWLRGLRPAVRGAVLIAAAAAALALGVNALRPGGLPLLAPAAAAGTVGLAELLRHLDQGTAVLVDARPPEDFADGHAPGALSIPAEPHGRYLSRVYDLLSPDEIILVYCKSPGCPAAKDLAEVLVANGFSPQRVLVFEPGWEALREALKGRRGGP
jgi:rhodanese-related sulfurtransferase